MSLLDTLGMPDGADAPHTCPCGHSAAVALAKGTGAWHAGHGSHWTGVFVAVGPSFAASA